MSITPVLDESVFKKWNSHSKVENLENFSFPVMKGPNNVSVRLDLFPEHKNHTSNMELNSIQKNKDGDCDFSKWNETEQLNKQVVFINPEWDEIEEEKAGISSILKSITPNITDEKSVPSQVTELVVTDSESVSSVTVSLDEFAEETEDFVAVISDSEADFFHAELLPQVEGHKEDKVTEKLFDHMPEDALLPRSKPDATTTIMNATTEVDNFSSALLQNDNNKYKSSGSKSENNKKRESEILESSKLMSAGCYVMQNGKIKKPFYIVKNPTLRDDAMYKNIINKNEELNSKKNVKFHNSSTKNEEERNILPLGRNTVKKKENHRETQLTEFGGNQQFIRMVEHPNKAKKIVVNKIGENNKIYQETSNSGKKQNTDIVEDVFEGNQSFNSMGNSCESDDLMWLLDFKLDDLFSESALPALSQIDDSLDQYSEFPGKFIDVDGSITNFNEFDSDDKIRGEREWGKSFKFSFPFSKCINLLSFFKCGFIVEIGCQTETATSKTQKFSNNKITGGGKQQQKTDGKSESSLPNRTFSDLKCSENRKPPFTYTELIECALQEKGPLTVSEIYNWIS